MQTLQVLDGTTPLDTVLYIPASMTTPPGPTAWPLTEGASKQVKTGSATTTANDDAVNWCNGSTPYGDESTANLGTPKAANNCP